MNVPWSPAAGAQFGTDWLLAAIAPAGDFGRRARERERAFRVGDESAARVSIARVDRIARALEARHLQALRAAIAAAPDPEAAIVRAQSGGVLADVDFFELVRFCDAVSDVAALAAAPAGAVATPRDGLLIEDAALTNSCVFAGVNVPAPDEALRGVLAPGVTMARTFYLDDAFDVRLERAREASAARAAAFAAARSRLAERVAAFAGLERVRDGEFVLMRDRIPAPLPLEIHVIREAPTYVLCEIALDDAALTALAARDDAEVAVAEVEEAVRARLSAVVASAAQALLAACDALGGLDLLIARALFAQRYGCVVPEIASDATLAFDSARYLPLEEDLIERGLPYVPISLGLDGAAVVTGPNMGGKTAALRTTGFLAACVALGLPVPARVARIPLVSEIAWLGLGAGFEFEGLSAFGAEVVALRTFLDTPPERPLVLADEFARTTSPPEGRALLVALLKILAARKTLALATTHFSGVATAAGIAHLAMGGLRGGIASDGAPLDLPAALARIAQVMDYRLFHVDDEAPIHSEALALAQALGLDEKLIACARETLACDSG